MELPKMTGWTIIGIILAIGVTILTALDKLPPEVFVATAAAAFGAIFQKGVGDTTVKMKQLEIDNYKATIKRLGGEK